MVANKLKRAEFFEPLRGLGIGRIARRVVEWTGLTEYEAIASDRV
jgi:hypothetical protein